jgi:DNA topoisomerase IB
MVEFARALPRLRRRVRDDLASDAEPVRDRVLACAVRLLDRGCFRIGGEHYAEQNETYGLVTMERRHLAIEDGLLVFTYEAKGGQEQLQVIEDPEILELMERLRRRRSSDPRLLAYRDGRRWTAIRSEDVNAYIKEGCEGEHSAKDFRTWNATVLAAVALGVGEPAETRAARERAVKEATKGVAAFLGNTPAVCRASYIDPRVFDRFRAGATIGPALRRVRLPEDVYDPKVQRSIERAVLRLIA